MPVIYRKSRGNAGRMWQLLTAFEHNSRTVPPLSKSTIIAEAE
jgi:hypothetical protein